MSFVTVAWPKHIMNEHGEAGLAAGDVVIAVSKQNPKHTICKRVLGLEGDDVLVKQSSRYGPRRTVQVVSLFSS